MRRLFVVSLVLISSSLAFAQGAKTPRPAITGISHVSFYADDLAKSQQFYTSLLGWEQFPAGAAKPGVRFYANHSQYVQLLPAPHKDMVNRLDSIGFSTDNAEALRAFLAANGITAPKAVTKESSGDLSFQVKDPEGNRIYFVQAAAHPRVNRDAASMPVSTHIIHAGFVAHDRAALDRFYKDLLGFHLYWQGGQTAAHTDWVMMQVPDGADWLEYMLYLPAVPSRGELGGANHFSPGVVSVAELESKLKQRGWVPSAQERPPLLGLDGKWQLDLLDPDGTRVEFMEFKPVKEPCCSAYTGTDPQPPTTW